MEDTLFMLRRAIELYVKNMGEQSYQSVLQALLVCLKDSVPVWMPATITGEEGQEMVKPGMIAGTDDGYYYIVCLEEHDFGQMDEGIRKIEIDLVKLLARAVSDRAIAGICLNPWDGGCFIPRDHILSVLDSLE